MTLLQPRPAHNSTQPTGHEEFGLLMSLALDGLLEEAEQARLDAHLAGCDACQAQWRLWRSLDAELSAAPQVAPPPQFVAGVVRRVQQAERRRRLKLGVTLGALAFIMWLVGLTGAVVVLGALLYNQMNWVVEILEQAAYLWTGLMIVVRTVGAALVSLAEEPTTVGAVLLYVVASLLILGAWTRFLRRSLRPVEEKEWVAG